MKRAVLAAAFAVVLPAWGAERPNCGTVESLEVTSLTRTKVAAFLRTRIPAAPPGAKNLFDGKIEVAKTVLPVAQPVTVLVQRGAGGAEAVFLVDLELSRIPAELVGRLRSDALDLTLEGNLSSSSSPSSAAPMPVCAAGVLKVGTNAIRAAGPLGHDFAKFSGARFRGMSLTETQGEANVLIFNPLSFPLDVKDLVYEIRAGERRVASGERHGVRLHPGRENALDLPVSAGNADLAAALAGAVASGGRVEGRLVAKISVKVGKDQSMTVSLDLPGTIQAGP